jgi:DNA-binding GntR family transcriptional regulator
VPIPAPHQAREPRRLIRDQAQDAIRKAILDGNFKPGEILEDRELQRWLQMSRTPIRQALFALTIEGLVETAPQAHTRVVRPRPEQAIEYLQAIGVLLVGITTLATEAATSSDRTRLVEILKNALAGAQDRNPGMFIEAVSRYFTRLNTLSSNAALARLVDHSAIALGYNLMIVFKTVQVPWDQIAAGYSALVHAWEQGNAETVEKATKVIFRLNVTP